MFKEILKDIVNEDYVSAKASIHEALYTLISRRLEEMYEDLSVEVIEGKKKLDPVGEEDGDVDNDGDEDESDGYLKTRRRAIGSAISRRKSQNEEVVTEMKKPKDNDGVQAVANTLSKHMVGANNANNKSSSFPPSEDITSHIRGELAGNIKYQNPQAQVPFGRED